MAFVHRKLWSFKPNQYGPWNIVHRNLLHNAEQMGFDPNSIELAMPMWTAGDQRDYSKNGMLGVNTGAGFENNRLHLDGATGQIAVSNSPVLTDKITSIISLTPHTLHYPETFWGLTGIWDTVANKRSYSLYSSSTSLTFDITTSGTYTAIKTAQQSTPVVLDERVVVSGVWDGTNSILYRDRDEVARNTAGSATGAVYDAFATVPYYVGAHQTSGTTYREAHIDVDYNLLFSSVLTPGKIALLYDNPYQLWQRVPQKTYFLSQEAGVSADLTGTAITGGVTESEIVTGGKTIIITLTGDTWVAAGATFEAQRQNIINGITSAQSEITGWNNEVRDNLAVTTVVRTSDTIVTVTLSAQAGYSITANETITITIPATALTAAGAVVATPTFDVTNEGAGFNAAWAGGANTLMQPGVAA